MAYTLLCVMILRHELSLRFRYDQVHYRGADKSLARPGRKQATVTEEFDVHMSYL